MRFIRQQLSPYCVERAGRPEELIPAMHVSGPIPHGRNDYTGEASDWGPNEYGYSDFDDYHLAIYGA